VKTIFHIETDFFGPVFLIVPHLVFEDIKCMNGKWNYLRTQRRDER